MKKIAAKILMASLFPALAACSSTEGFPSLFGFSGNNVTSTNASYSSAPGTYSGTFVGQKVIAFRKELAEIKESARINRNELQQIRNNILNNTTSYNKNIGTIETKLQVGTTPGNPNMYNLLQQAQNQAQALSLNANALENLSSKVANNATSINYLLDSIRAAFHISGAVDEDHRDLRSLQNEAEQLSVTINSLNKEITTDSNRQQQFVADAQVQLNRLNNAIKAGNFQGNAAVKRPVGKPVLFGNNASSANAGTARYALPGKPLFVAKFAHDNVDYKDGLRTAVKAALERKANAVFDVVAISDVSSQGKAQNHANRIFQEIIEMGVNAGQVNISARNNAKTTIPEVMIFVK